MNELTTVKNETNTTDITTTDTNTKDTKTIADKKRRKKRGTTGIELIHIRPKEVDPATRRYIEQQLFDIFKKYETKK